MVTEVKIVGFQPREWKLEDKEKVEDIKKRTTAFQTSALKLKLNDEAFELLRKVIKPEVMKPLEKVKNREFAGEEAFWKEIGKIEEKDKAQIRKHLHRNVDVRSSFGIAM